MNRFIPLVIMISAMMPYLPGGLRVEHVLLPVMVLLTPITLYEDNKLVGGARVAMLICLLVLSAAVVATLVSSAFSPMTGAAGRPDAMFVRVLMPALFAAAFPFFLSRVPNNVLSRTALAIVVVAIPAGFIALGSALTDLSSVISPWVVLDPGSVWASSVSIGRYPGLFNQPLEAGLFFSVAALAQVYVLKVRSGNFILNAIGILAIMAGGMISLSKNFSLVGLPLALLLAALMGLVNYAVSLIALLLAVIVVPIVVLKVNPIYFNALIDMYHRGGVLMALSAGRLGSSNTAVSELFSELWSKNNWILGFGLGSRLPLDSGYLEYFYQGGIVAIMGYLAFLVIVGMVALRNIKTSEGKLIFCLFLLAIVGSIGGPVVTANRASVAFMLMLIAALVSTDGK